MSDLHFDLIFNLYLDLRSRRLNNLNCHNSEPEILHLTNSCQLNENSLSYNLVYEPEIWHGSRSRPHLSRCNIDFDLSFGLDLNIGPQILNLANFLASNLKFYMEVDLDFP